MFQALESINFISNDICSRLDGSNVPVQSSLRHQLDWIIMLHFGWEFLQTDFDAVKNYLSKQLPFSAECNYYYSYQLVAIPSTIPSIVPRGTFIDYPLQFIFKSCVRLFLNRCSTWNFYARSCWLFDLISFVAIFSA